MKTLLIFRHAKSSWKDLGLRDFDRPLNKRGKMDAPRMGKLLAEQDLVPDLIITSAATRARLTAEAVAETSGYDAEIFETSELYMAMPEDYIAVLNHVQDSNTLVMVVGHNPGIEDLIEDLTGEWYRMPTAALAHIQLDIDSWQSLDAESEGELVNNWYPKEL